MHWLEDIEEYNKLIWETNADDLYLNYSLNIFANV